ncbi:MAG: hypothetical protein ACLR44_03580 [Clostridia bacterium]
MAGYVIHLAVAESYIKKHEDDIKDYNRFIEGVIFPDSISDKSITHYGEKSSKTDLKAFLEDNKIDNDYNKGYFLHLVTDYIFYNKLLKYFSKDIYNDYDILNEKLQKKFNVTLPENIKDKVFYKEGKTKVLKLENIIKFIEDVSDYKLDEIKERILDNDNYWLEIKELREI